MSWACAQDKPPGSWDINDRRHGVEGFPVLIMSDGGNEVRRLDVLLLRNVTASMKTPGSPGHRLAFLVELTFPLPAFAKRIGIGEEGKMFHGNAANQEGLREQLNEVE